MVTGELPNEGPTPESLDAEQIVDAEQVKAAIQARTELIRNDKTVYKITVYYAVEAKAYEYLVPGWVMAQDGIFGLLHERGDIDIAAVVVEIQPDVESDAE